MSALGQPPKETEGPIRWLALVTYRSDHGPNVVTKEMSELGEIEDFIEHGPHWDTVDSILIVRRDGDKKLTTEQAALL